MKTAQQYLAIEEMCGKMRRGARHPILRIIDACSTMRGPERIFIGNKVAPKLLAELNNPTYIPRGTLRISRNVMHYLDLPIAFHRNVTGDEIEIVDKRGFHWSC